jgi:hypothetical protein
MPKIDWPTALIAVLLVMFAVPFVQRLLSRA